MSFSPEMTVNEIAKMRLAIALRATLKIGAKILFRAMKVLKNGALWCCYSINGVKCSTFIKKDIFEAYLEQAKKSPELKEVFNEYAQSLANRTPSLALSFLFGGGIKVVKTVPDSLYPITLQYFVYFDEASGSFRIMLEQGFAQVPDKNRAKWLATYPTLSSVFKHLAKK